MGTLGKLKERVIKIKDGIDNFIFFCEPDRILDGLDWFSLWINPLEDKKDVAMRFLEASIKALNRGHNYDELAIRNPQKAQESRKRWLDKYTSELDFLKKFDEMDSSGIGLRHPIKYIKEWVTVLRLVRLNYWKAVFYPPYRATREERLRFGG
jgi:hypothetical protein